ncbi:Tau-tubulin kinase 2, partial [Blyttiomyces sp. JEL0837]
MVMELLGPNLSDLRRKSPSGRFSVSTTALLGQQMVRAIEALHAVGILHRDIKPGNFCMSVDEVEFDCGSNGQVGNGEEEDVVLRQRCYLIDFGLSRRYLSAGGRVREPRSKVGFRGTARYASINAHLGAELGRVDDLWSFFYLIVEFLKGSLPWKGKEKDRIGELKQRYTTRELVEGLPNQMFELFDYLCTLKYWDRPDYDFIWGCMRRLFLGTGKPAGVRYDWIDGGFDPELEGVDVTGGKELNALVAGRALARERSRGDLKVDGGADGVAEGDDEDVVMFDNGFSEEGRVVNRATDGIPTKEAMHDHYGNQPNMNDFIPSGVPLPHQQYQGVPF